MVGLSVPVETGWLGVAVIAAGWKGVEVAVAFGSGVRMTGAASRGAAGDTELIAGRLQARETTSMNPRKRNIFRIMDYMT